MTAIRFPGGYLGLFDAEDLRRLLEGVHRAFAVKKDCPVCGTLFPGQMDMEMVSVYRRYHVSPLMFEIPSLSFRECEKFGYPLALQALDKTVYLLQNFSEAEWGLRFPIGIPGRTEGSWKFLLGQIYHYQPTYLQFFSIGKEKEENPAFAEVCRDLTEHGYHRFSGNLYSLAQKIPPILMEEGEETEYVGAGLGSVSVIDGFRVKNTIDPEKYDRCCDDYRLLMEECREL